MTESESNSGDQSWRTNLLRSNVRNKIEEAIRMSGNPTSKTVSEMENHIFVKARTKEEYLSFVARLILHVKEMNSKRQQSSGMQQIVGQNPGIIGGQQVSQQESDPMSALQNMAGPQTMNDISNGNPMHLQVSNVGNDQILANNQSSAMIPNMSHIQNMNQNPNQLNQNPNQMNQNRVQNPMAMTGNRMMSQQMMGPNANNPRPQQVLSSNLQAQLQRLRQPNPNMNMSGLPPVQESKYFDGQQMQNTSAVPQNPNQFKGNSMSGQQFALNQNQNMIVQNQNQSITNMQQINQMNPQLNPPTPQMMPSPSGYAPSPSPMMPSPHGQLIRPSSSMGAPSPQNISLNTPANIMIASPGSVGPGGRPEEQIYLEKVRNLQKYAEPLRKMIARIDQDDRFSNEKKKEFDKMKNLLSILTDPSRRCPMSTLEKCEQFLEKMDFKMIKTEPPTVAPTVAPIQSHPVPKIQDICQPLLDAINAHIRKPLFNHTLQRTFGPAVAALTHNPYKQTSPPNNKRKFEDECDVSEVLQGEIARLDARFKVQLDPLQHFGSKTIHIICKLDDKDLPCVPPLSIQVPESYPESSPQCSTDLLEYSASTFFEDIQKKFDTNIAKLPLHFSVTSLLNSWELSVRQAVSAALDPIGG